MNFKHNDIIIRNETKTEVWVSERLVVEVCGDILEKYLRTHGRNRYKSSVPATYHKSKYFPVTGKAWRWTRQHGQFYYDLDFIPNHKPNYYRELFGDKQTLIDNYKNHGKSQDEKLFESHFKLALNETYGEYLHCYIDYKEQHRVALAKACAALEYGVEYIENSPNAKGDTAYREIAKVIEKLELQYLPKNYRNIKQKIDAVRNGGHAIAELVQLPREGNNNALVHDDPQVLSWAIQLRAMDNNCSNEHITRVITENCLLQSKKVPSRRWFGANVYEQHEIKFLTASKRFGAGSRKAFHHEGYIPMEGAINAGDCWQIDATRLNIISHKRVEIAEDGTKTTSDAFLFVIVVRDVHSGCILGHSFDYSENRWSVFNALKMAVETAGHLPYELAYDRFPGHNTTEWELLFERMKTIGVKLTKTHKATGKAAVERFFGTLQDVILQHDKHYYGQGIQSRELAAHKSPEYLARIKKEARAAGFDLQAAIAVGEQAIAWYNATPYSYYSRKHAKLNQSPKEIYSKHEKPCVNWLENRDISMLMGLKKEITIKHNGMIKTEMHGIEYIYHVEDYGIYSKESKVVLSYDLSDLSSVYLFKPNGNLLIYLGEANVFNKPVQYGPQAEHNKIATEKKRQKEITERKEADLQEKTAIADETPLLMGRFTNKAESEYNETLFLTSSNPKEGISHPTTTIKKAVGSDYNTDNDFVLKSIINDY